MLRGLQSAEQGSQGGHRGHEGGRHAEAADHDAEHPLDEAALRALEFGAENLASNEWAQRLDDPLGLLLAVAVFAQRAYGPVGVERI